MKARYETISEKATRLKNNCRTILTGPDEALVIGDHDTYRVSRHLDGWRCTCPWGRYRGNRKDCSHVAAVRQARKDPASQAPIVRLAEVLRGAEILVGGR